MAIKQQIKSLLNSMGLQVTRTRTFRKPAGNMGRVAHLPHQGKKKGDVLISYVIEPFLLSDEGKISNHHHHDWLSWQIGKTFSDFGYDIDVIDYNDRKFAPQKPYDFFIGARTNFQRLAELLPEKCIKIVHLDTAHWLFNNSAAFQRHLDLQERRKVVLDSFKWVEPNWAVEHADYATTNWGNQFNVGTYSYAGKPIFQIPLPTCSVYKEPDRKDFDSCKNRFLWLGSDGLVHKGLDLTLEAFASLPDCHLTVCGPLRTDPTRAYQGPLKNDAAFENAYHAELYECDNIHVAGWIDVESDSFHQLVNQCVGVIFPSCSEGGGASAITCMQAGLIPIVSYETNVYVGDFGYTLKTNTIEEIQNTVKQVSCFDNQELMRKSQDAWNFCRSHHTREEFAKRYKEIVEKIMAEKGML